MVTFATTSTMPGAIENYSADPLADFCQVEISGRAMPLENSLYLAKGMKSMFERANIYAHLHSSLIDHSALAFRFERRTTPLTLGDLHLYNFTLRDVVAVIVERHEKDPANAPLVESGRSLVAALDQFRTLLAIPVKIGDPDAPAPTIGDNGMPEWLDDINDPAGLLIDRTVGDLKVALEQYYKLGMESLRTALTSLNLYLGDPNALMHERASSTCLLNT